MSPDCFSTEVRSRVMSRVKCSDTQPELLLRHSLFAIGLRGWRCHRRTLPGTPDVSFGRSRVAVFVDGAFWHGHPSKYKRGRSGRFWDEKIARNVERDRCVDDHLARLGWTVLRLWDFEILKGPDEAAARVAALVLRGASPSRASALATRSEGKWPT